MQDPGFVPLHQPTDNLRYLVLNGLERNGPGNTYLIEWYGSRAVELALRLPWSIARASMTVWRKARTTILCLTLADVQATF